MEKPKKVLACVGHCMHVSSSCSLQVSMTFSTNRNPTTYSMVSSRDGLHDLYQSLSVLTGTLQVSCDCYPPDTAVQGCMTCPIASLLFFCFIFTISAKASVSHQILIAQSHLMIGLTFGHPYLLLM